LENLAKVKYSVGIVGLREHQPQAQLLRQQLDPEELNLDKVYGDGILERIPILKLSEDNLYYERVGIASP
jgi:hypothetical protein